jgi:hypothetical protein
LIAFASAPVRFGTNSFADASIHSVDSSIAL